MEANEANENKVFNVDILTIPCYNIYRYFRR